MLSDQSNMTSYKINRLLGSDILNIMLYMFSTLLIEIDVQYYAKVINILTLVIVIKILFDTLIGLYFKGNAIWVTRNEKYKNLSLYLMII